MSRFWLDRPTLVTGATGLVGGWVIRRLLESGADVVCLVRDWVPQSELVRSGLLSKVKTVRGDVRDQALLERILGEYETDTVLHLAAQTIVTIANRNPVSTFESNVAGTWALLEAARRSSRVKQIVVASSDKAYGDHASAACNESSPLAGRHPYAVSKSCADLIAQSYAATYDLPVAITRCGNFYGGGDLNWNRIVPGTIRSVLRDEAPIIRSDGKLVRDYFYVEDGAAAYMTVAEQMASNRALCGEAFNFSDETPLTVSQVVDHILAAMGSPLRPQVLNEASHEIREQHLNSEKARRVLNWRPLFSLDDGLRRSVAWYRDFFAGPMTAGPRHESRTKLESI
jgi:CDP-glucose 4,6-dehydratase